MKQLKLHWKIFCMCCFVDGSGFFYILMGKCKRQNEKFELCPIVLSVTGIGSYFLLHGVGRVSRDGNLGIFSESLSIDSNLPTILSNLPSIISKSLKFALNSLKFTLNLPLLHIKKLKSAHSQKKCHMTRESTQFFNFDHFVTLVSVSCMFIYLSFIFTRRNLFQKIEKE